ncbi:MAG: cation:proton antiporter [Candidatus Heimdallarchaeaceae archaeon]
MNEATSLLLYIGVAILAARIFGEIFERLKLSAILGELFAGILLGGPLFSILGLSEINDLFMDKNSLRSFSQIGIILLLFIVGMEINVKSLLKTGKRSMTISITEVSVALVGGFLTAFIFLERDVRFAIFFGTLFTATSIGVTVRSLSDLKKLGSEEGQTLLSIAVLDDFIALILVLILASALFNTEEGNIATIILKDLGLLAAFILVVVVLLPKFLNWIEYRFNVFTRSRTNNFTLGIVFGLISLLAYFAEELHFSGAVMAFLLGISIQQDRIIVGEIKGTITKFGEGVFIPLFFFSVGSNFQIDLTQLGSANYVFPWGIWLVIPFAILSKGIGAFVGSKMTGFSSKSALRIAIGITPRAEILLVIAGIGLENEIFDENIFTIVILLVFVTVLLTPLMLQLAFKEKGDKGDKDDKEEDQSSEETKGESVKKEDKISSNH